MEILTIVKESSWTLWRFCVTVGKWYKDSGYVKSMRKGRQAENWKIYLGAANKLPVTVIGNNVGKIGWAWYGKGTLEYWADQPALFYRQKRSIKGL